MLTFQFIEENDANIQECNARKVNCIPCVHIETSSL